MIPIFYTAGQFRDIAGKHHSLMPSIFVDRTLMLSTSKKAPAGPLPKLNSVPFLFLFMILSFQVHSQDGSVKGKLEDAGKNPVPFANMLVYDKDSTFINGTLTDSTGTFFLKGLPYGTYLLKFSAIGYIEHWSSPFTLSAEQSHADLGTISLKTDSKTLEDVKITALRPTVTRQIDKLVVTVEGTALAAGNSAFTVLSRAPGVFVDAEGNVRLNGRAGVLILIDGKQTYLSAADLRTFLEGMSAENLKNIELITNPSAKYDAEGTSGVINIVLKKNTLRGINGSVHAGYSYNFYNQHGATSGLSLNHRAGPWTSFMTLDYARRVGGRNATFTRVFNAEDHTTYFDQTAIGNFTAQGPPTTYVGTDYAINTKHSIGVTARYMKRNLVSDFLTDTYIGDVKSQPAQFIDADNINNNSFSNLSANLHYTGSLDTVGKKLTADVDYITIRNEAQAHLNNYYTDLRTGNQWQDLLYTNNPNGYDIYSARIDFTYPVSQSAKLETGARGSLIRSVNDFQFYYANETRVLDPLRTNYFKYDERILAAYANYNTTINKKLSAQTGLRVENTLSQGNSITLRQTTTRYYTNLFPSIFIQQKVNNFWSVNYNYSRRITRPNYGNLNPYRAYRDPYTWYQGNTQLFPAYTHNFALSQSFKEKYNVEIEYQLTKNMMAEIPILLVDDTVTIYTTGNVNNGYNLGLTALVPVRIAKWWETQNTLVLNHAYFAYQSNNGLLVNELTNFMIQTSQSFLLPKGIKIELNAMYSGPEAYGVYRVGALHRVDVGVRKTFFSDKFELSVNFNDIFKGYRYYWTTDINGNVNDFDQYFRLRTVVVNMRYNFKKGQKVNTQRRNRVEELDRT